jgi:hypothetical protein
MAEKTIGIKIQLNGMNTVVKDIETFERLLKEAKEDLKQIPIGEKNFKDLTKEIANAEGQLRNLTEAQRGLTSEKASEGLSKFGSGIASSFAAATAAVGLFGQESEDVSKAAADAQNLLTLALSIRGIAEIKTGAAIVAKTIVEKASAAATTATSTATKELYLTLAANPYGAIIAVLGLLTTAYFLLGSEEEETAEKTKSLNELIVENGFAAVGTTSKIKLYNSILMDTTTTLDEQAGVYAQLQKLVPELSNLTLEQAKSTNILNAAIERQIQLEELRAEQKALEDFLVQSKKKQIEQEEKLYQQRLKSAKADAENAREFLLRQGVSFEEATKTYNFVLAQGKARLGVLSTEERLVNVTRQIAGIEGQQLKTIEKYKTSQKEVTKETEAQKKNSLEFQLNYERTLQYLSELAVQYKKFAEEAQVDRTTPLIVETIKGLTDARKALADPSLTKIFKELGIQIREFNGGLEITGDVLRTLGDEFGKYYEDTRDILSAQATDTRYTFDELTKTINTLLDEVSLRFQRGEITKDAFEAFQQLGKQYLEFGKLVRDNPPFEGESLKEFLDLEKQILIATGLYTKEYDSVNQTIVDVKGNVISLTSAIQRQDDILVDFRAKYESQLVKELDAQKLIGEGYKDQVKILIERGKITKEQGDKFLSAEDSKKRNDELIKLIDELTKARIDALKSTTRFIVEQETVIREFYDAAIKAQQEGLALSAVAIKNTLLNNLDLVISLTQKENKIVIDEKKLQVDQLLKLEQDLAMKGIDITKLTEEEKLKILKAYLDKQKEEKDKAASDDEKRGKITLETVSKTLGQVSSLIGRLSSLTSQFYAFQLQKLQTENEKALTNVVGDTEEANTKRLELEQQYQTQKAYIEKQATIKALQFQLAQAIVDGAQAVIAVAEIPPLAIATGLLVAGQILLIRQQLAYAQSLAGGGKIRMGASGMVVGPSHENGGVMYAGGYNLEGGETIVNRVSSANYSGLLSSINQAGGGQPIISNATNSLMEERLVQAIAKTRSTPIRAYVLEQDITRSQTIQRKLDQLATI